MKCKSCEWYIVANCKSGDGFCTLPITKTRQCKNCEWFVKDSETNEGFCTLFKWNTDNLGFCAAECGLFECAGDVKTIFDE